MTPPAEPVPAVLLVDDRWENLLALQAVLDGMGLETVPARSGEEALRHVLERDFAVVLMDVVMPGLDGMETAGMIHARERSRHTPIIFLTAVDTGWARVLRGYSVGAVDYIFKPIDSEVLRSKVSVFVELWRKNLLLEAQGRELLLARQREHEAALARVEAQRHRFFSLALELMGVVDLEGRIREANPAWERSLGLGAPELEGRLLLDLVVPEDRAAAEEAWSRVRAGGREVAWESRCRARDGGVRWIAWTATGFPEEGTGYVAGRDVSHLRQALETVERHAADLARSNAQLEQFAFVASHDLREPLRTVVSFLQLLRRDHGRSLAPEAGELIETAVDGARRMYAMIEDLLAYSRAGRRDEALQEVDCRQALDAALANLRRAIDDCGAVVEREDLPRIRGRAGHLVTVFQNLLDNAMKYRGAEPPRIRVGGREDRDGWTLWVGDNGIGIAPQHRERIFRVFQRLDPSGSHPGTGIGLAIVRKIVEQGGGRVWVESAPGRGSTFYFTLPRPAQTGAGRAAPAVSTSTAPG